MNEWRYICISMGICIWNTIRRQQFRYMAPFATTIPEESAHSLPTVPAPRETELCKSPQYPSIFSLARRRTLRITSSIIHKNFRFSPTCRLLVSTCRLHAASIHLHYTFSAFLPSRTSRQIFAGLKSHFFIKQPAADYT